MTGHFYDVQSLLFFNNKKKFLQSSPPFAICTKFFRWRSSKIMPAAAKTAVGCVPLPDKRASAGRRAAIAAEPSAKYPDTSTAAAPPISAPKPIAGENNTAAVPAQAIPFPPRKPFQTGQQCPITAPKPAYKTPRRSGPGSKSKPQMHANTVFRISPHNTIIPYRVPKRDATFAVPGFPKLSR